MSEKKIYKEYFDIDPKYYAAVTADLIKQGKVSWKNFYPHETFVKLLEKTHTVLSGKDPRSLWVEGAYGTGKSHAAEQLARDLGIRFYTANRVQNTFELTGFVNAAGKYVPTPFYRAFTEGGLFFFDEVDASSPEALVTINTATAQGYMAFPGRTGNVMAHPDFKVVCAGNTYGTGSTSEYTGRNKLDAATLDRFMVIDWGYDEGLEKQLVDNDRLLDICWKLRRVCEKLNLKVIVSTRGIKSLSVRVSPLRLPMRVTLSGGQRKTVMTC